MFNSSNSENGTFSILNGPTKGDIVEIRPTPKTHAGHPVFAIGHHEKADLNLPDSHVKPVHALMVRHSDGGYLINPKQGTVYVNDIPIHDPCRLMTTDRVKVGRTVLEFKGAEGALPSNLAPRKAKKPRRESTASEKFIWVMYGVAAFIIIGLIALGLDFRETMALEQEIVRQEIAANGTPVTVLFFRADWCSYCEQQAPTMRELDRAYGDYVEVYFVDIDDYENASLERQFGVRSIPHTVILDDQGNVAEQFIGYTERRRLEGAINGVY
jgi:thiol-disulfide isomerase/thioredoxin